MGMYAEEAGKLDLVERMGFLAIRLVLRIEKAVQDRLYRYMDRRREKMRLAHLMPRKREDGGR